MVPSSLGITLFPLLVGGLLGSFLLLVMWLMSSPLVVKMMVSLGSNHLVVRVGERVLFVKVSRGSDLQRKPECPIVYGEGRGEEGVTVALQPIPDVEFWEQEEGCQEGGMGCPAQGAGWIRKGLAEYVCTEGEVRHFHASRTQCTPA